MEQQSSESTPVVKQPAKVSTVPKWEESARARIQSGLRKIAKPLNTMLENDAVEADTRHLVTDILEILGYDKYENLTAEYSVKGDFADYGIRIDKQLVAFVEVKRITQKLSNTHLRQVESYALKEGVKWAFLTNAQVWQVYHIVPKAGQQSEVTLVLEVDLLSENVKPSTKTDMMFLFSKEGLSRGRLNDFMSAQDAVSSKTLIPILTSNAIIDAVRKEVKRKTKHNVDPKDLRQAIEGILS